MSSPLDPGKEARAAGGIPIVGAFDGYRAVAIFGVALFHIFLFSGVAGALGDSAGGVAAFGTLPRVPLVMLFVVSGFVLFLPTAARGGRFGDVGDYALRRAARILPAYWLSLVVAIVLLAVLPLGPGIPGIGEIALHATMLQTPAPLFNGDFALGFGIVASVWTLSVETVFYLLLPLVAAAYYRRPLVGLAIAAALLVGWRLVALHVDSIFGAGAATQERFDVFYASQFPSWGLSFAAGMTGAWAYVRLREIVAPALLQRRALAVLAAATVATVAVVIFAGREAVNDPNVLAGLFARQSLAVSFTLPLALGTAMVALALAPAQAQLPFAGRPLRSLGDISYGVYLIHLAVIAVIVAELSLPRDGSLSAVLQWIAIVIPASLAYAYLSAVLLERPLRRWARRVRPGRRAVVAEDTLPAVSIVIPTHNRREWLAGAVDSVLEQDYANLEALVVDDGSGDGTADLLRDYGRRWPEHRFRHLSQANAGQARAINRGNRAARGEILGYLSDDDVLLPGAVSALAAELMADPSAAAAYPAYREIDAEGRVEDTVRPIEYSPRAALLLHDTVIGPGGLARRGALERAGGWDPSLRWMGDLVMWMGVGLAGRVVRVAEPLACWRRHPGSATLQPSAEHAREHLRIVELGSSLDGMGVLSTADRAEATRNACFFGAFFGATGDTWPGERFVVFDLHRRLLSASTSKLGPGGGIDWDEAERSAALYRELVELVAQGADRPEPGAGGLHAALARLREIGVTGAVAGEVDPGELRLGLIEAAFACGADTGAIDNRFVIVERGRVRFADAELDEVVALGFASSAAELEAALSDLRARRAQPGSARG